MYLKSTFNGHRLYGNGHVNPEFQNQEYIFTIPRSLKSDRKERGEERQIQSTMLYKQTRKVFKSVLVTVIFLEGLKIVVKLAKIGKSFIDIKLATCLIKFPFFSYSI